MYERVLLTAGAAAVAACGAIVVSHGSCALAWGVAGAFAARPVGRALMRALEAAADRADPGGASPLR